MICHAHDNGGRRSGIDRRIILYFAYIPEQRVGQDRRSGYDRRQIENNDQRRLNEKRRLIQRKQD